MSVLPQVVSRNWRLKVSAFVLAVFLWVIVTVQPQNREILPAVPVDVVLSDPSWALAEPASPATVSVHLGGRELFELPRASSARIRIPIDLVTGEDTVIRLRPDWVVLSDGSEAVVQSIMPASVTLRFEQTLATALPLSLRTISDFPDGLALVQPLGLSPQVTTVRGPARLVEALDSVSLVPLDLSRVGESGLYRVQVDTSETRGLSFQPNSAQISVNLQPAVERVADSVRVVVEPPPGVDSASLVAQPATVRVTLRGAEGAVTQASLEGLAVVVSAGDLEGIAPGNEWSVPIRVRGLPPLVRGVPQVDSVRVLRGPALPGTPPDTVRRDTLARPSGGGGG